VPADQEPPPYEVLAVLVVSLRGELARAQERIAGLEDRPGQPGAVLGTARLCQYRVA